MFSEINNIYLMDIVVVVNICVFQMNKSSGCNDIKTYSNMHVSEPDLLSAVEKLLCWRWQWGV